MEVELVGTKYWVKWSWWSVWGEWSVEWRVDQGVSGGVDYVGRWTTGFCGLERQFSVKTYPRHIRENRKY